MEQVRIVIEGVTPQVDAGRFAVKLVEGDELEVGADIWKDGHELLKAVVQWRALPKDQLRALAHARPPDRSARWREAPLTTSFEANDRWTGRLQVDAPGPWVFTILAWTDAFGSWRGELEKKLGAGQDVHSELLEGVTLVEKALAVAKGPGRDELAKLAAALRAAPDDATRARLALEPRLRELMTAHDPRAGAEGYDLELPLWVDRERARFGSWYELFPRSQGTNPRRGSTLREAEARLPAIAAMGFDVLYLPPVHPIGTTARKGKNNAEKAQPGDVGSPWAIGGPEGGHDAVHPDLGTIADFDHYVAAARALGMELALDFAVQCSPDHPWVKQHPEWFAHRPDGTIKYAENPPKKYQDIYPIDFETKDRDGLYQGLLGVVRFWMRHGVRIFRVDNPHTKAQSFWEWLIAEVHREDPGVLFLAEAFTRPKRMRHLAKLGFTQSYTYFTWRTGRRELEEYAQELFVSELRHVMRPNFFANTPDILHEILQHGGKPAFELRLVLAATLSPTYGIYSGYELCENVPVRPGSEEYLDSEKYQIRVRDWNPPGSLVPFVTTINRIRREHPALQRGDGLRLLDNSNPNVLSYAKVSPDGRDRILCVVNLDPFHLQEGILRVPDDIRRSSWQYVVRDLLSGADFSWQGGEAYFRLDPQVLPAHVLHILL